MIINNTSNIYLVILNLFKEIDPLPKQEKNFAR